MNDTINIELDHIDNEELRARLVACVDRAIERAPAEFVQHDQGRGMKLTTVNLNVKDAMGASFQRVVQRSGFVEHCVSYDTNDTTTVGIVENAVVRAVLATSETEGLCFESLTPKFDTPERLMDWFEATDARL